MVLYFTATGNSLYVAKQLDEERLSIPQEMNKENRHYKAERIGIVPSLTRQRFIRPEYEKAHTIYQRFSYTRDDLIVDKYSNRPE